jgi:hypothetical protein
MNSNRPDYPAHVLFINPDEQKALHNSPLRVPCASIVPFVVKKITSPT